MLWSDSVCSYLGEFNFGTWNSSSEIKIILFPLSQAPFRASCLFPMWLSPFSIVLKFTRTETVSHPYLYSHNLLTKFDSHWNKLLFSVFLSNGKLYIFVPSGIGKEKYKDIMILRKHKGTENGAFDHRQTRREWGRGVLDDWKAAPSKKVTPILQLTILSITPTTHVKVLSGSWSKFFRQYYSYE